jgi:hypothetical protein
MNGRSNRFSTTNQPSPSRRSHKGNRSAFTAKRWVLADVDMRRPSGRRFVDLCKGFAKEIGVDLTEAERALIRQAAAMTLQAELLQAALARGEPVNADDTIRLSSEARRILASITARAARRKAPGEPTPLERYLAGGEVTP